MLKSDIEFVVLAAGKSTRNYPHSKGIPHKALVPFGSRKVIDHIVKEIINAGGKNITFVVSSEKTKEAFEECFRREKDIEEKFKKKNNMIGLELLQSLYLPEDINIKYVIQKEPKGLAHAIGLAAKNSPNKNIGVIFPDDIVISSSDNGVLNRAVDQYIKDGYGGNLFVTMNVKNTSRYGIIEKGVFKEKPKSTTSNEASIMFFILDKNIAKILTGIAEKADNLGTEEFNLWAENKEELHYAKYLNEAIEKNPEKMRIRTEKIKSDEIYLDCGTIQGYEKSLIYALLKESIFKEENVKIVKEILK